MKEVRRRSSRAAREYEEPAEIAPVNPPGNMQLKPPGTSAEEASHSVVPTKLSSAEFNTAIAHFYRGEVQRANTWRNRLDTTTNWAVITAAGTLSFAFSSPANPHFVIPINSVLIAYFLFIEARRYRYYELWSSRIRVVETGYFARMLAPTKDQDDGLWAQRLADNLLTPHFTISEWEAVGRRLRRNYLWIFALLAFSWNLKVYLHPQPAYDFNEFISRAAVGFIPGSMIFLAGVIFNVVIALFALATVRLKEATGEVLPHHEFPLRTFRRVKRWTRDAAGHRRVILRRSQKARERIRGRRASAFTRGWRNSKPRQDQVDPVSDEVG